MSSLKQRAMQCSGHIPASQYVPVYSRPHRTNQARWHEEIAPITPKPTLDNTRTQSIHEAVKMWLDSSPNSVIGPLYRSGSPFSGSPPSNGESFEPQQQQQAFVITGPPTSAGSPPSNGESFEPQHQQQAVVTAGPPGEASSSDTSLLESQNERFYDVGSGGLSPQQISMEQSGLASGSSTSSSMPAEQVNNSRPSWLTRTKPALDVGAAPSPPKQKSEAESPEHVLPKDDDKSNASDAVPPSIREVSWAGNQVPRREEQESAQAEEGTKSPTQKRRGGKKRPNSELKAPERERLYGLSVGSMSDFNSRAVSREFDTALAFVVNDIDKPKPIDTLSCISDYSSVVGVPNVLLKPPRGLEKSVAHDGDQNSAVAESPPRPRAASARQDRNSEATRIPPFPQATSAREDQNSAVTRTPLFYRLGGTREDTTTVAGGAKADSNSEIVPACDPEIVEDDEKENICEAEQSPLPANAHERKKLGYRANLKKIDEVGSKNKNPDGPSRLTIQAVLQYKDNWKADQVQQAQQAQKTKMKSCDSSPLAVSNGVAAVDGGYEFRHDRSTRQSPSHYSEGGSVTSTPNSVHQQPIRKVSPLHYMVGKENLSKKQNSVAPSESPQQSKKQSSVAPSESPQQSKKQNFVAPSESPQQLRRAKSGKSSEREASPKIEAVDKAKLEELRVKADAWENAKVALILNRYKREESKIVAWEERKVAKATASLSKIELNLEKKRAKLTEKMQYEVGRAHRKAAEMKANAEAKRAERAAKAAVQAQVLRVMGKSRFSSCFR